VRACETRHPADIQTRVSVLFDDRRKVFHVEAPLSSDDTRSNHAIVGRADQAVWYIKSVAAWADLVSGRPRSVHRLSWVNAEVLAHLKLHSVDFSQKS
jgi:hypothetical protein